jgi:hypothetical protein
MEKVCRVIAPLDLDETTMRAVRIGLVKASFVRNVEEVEVRPLGEVPDRARQGLHPPAVTVGVSLSEPGHDDGAEQSPLAMGKGGSVNRNPADRPPSTRSSTAANASVDGRLESSMWCRIDPIATSSRASAAKL